MTGTLDMKVISKSSSLTFFLPLLLRSESYANLRERAETALIPGERVSSVDHPPLFWRRCGYQIRHLLPHLKNYLYDGDPKSGSTGTLLTTTNQARAWLRGPEQAKASWILKLPGGRSVEFIPRGGYLFLFYSGVVMVGVDVEATSSDAADWLDLLHYGSYREARAKTLEVVAEDKGWMATLLDSLVGPDDKRVIRTGEQLSATFSGLTPFLELFMNTAVAGEFPISSAAVKNDGPALGRDAIDVEIPVDSTQMQTYSVLLFQGSEAVSQGIHLVHRVAGAHHSGRERFSFDFDVANQEGVVPYQENTWFFVTLEGGGFVAVHAEDEPISDFELNELPLHARTDYLLAFAFCSFQRLTMIYLSKRVVNFADELVAGRKPRKDETVLGLHRDVLEFTSRGVFAQISQSQHHHLFYRAAQRANQIPELHGELRSEVEALKEFEEAHQTARREGRSKAIELVLGLVTGVVIPMQLVAGLFPSTVSEWPVLKGISPTQQEIGAFISIGVLIVLVVGLFAWAGRRRA